MKENIVKNKSYAFALRIVKAYKYLTNEQQEFILSKQILRSGTAIGAFTSIHADCDELIRLLVSIIKTTKDHGK